MTTVLLLRLVPVAATIRMAYFCQKNAPFAQSPADRDDHGIAAVDEPTGLFGKNAAEAAERLIARSVELLTRDGTLPRPRSRR